MSTHKQIKFQDDVLRKQIKELELDNLKLKDLSEDLKSANLELEGRFKELSQVKAKEEFISMITHELRTPLTPIIGWCEALKMSKTMGDLTTKQTSAVDAIFSNAQQLRLLIGNLLDAQKLELG